MQIFKEKKLSILSNPKQVRKQVENSILLEKSLLKINNSLKQLKSVTVPKPSLEKPLEKPLESPHNLAVLDAKTLSLTVDPRTDKLLQIHQAPRNYKKILQDRLKNIQ